MANDEGVSSEDRPWQSVDSGYEGDQRRIIVYRSAPGDLQARREAYEHLAQTPAD